MRSCTLLRLPLAKKFTSYRYRCCTADIRYSQRRDISVFKLSRGTAHQPMTRMLHHIRELDALGSSLSSDRLLTADRSFREHALADGGATGLQGSLDIRGFRFPSRLNASP